MELPSRPRVLAPSRTYVEESRLFDFSCWLAATARFRAADPHDYRELWSWSVRDPQAFWAAVWDYFRLRSAAPPGPAMVVGEHMMKTRWFPEAQLNFADHAINGHDPDALALISESEAGEVREVTYAQLKARVSALSNTLQAHGVDKGDVVVGFVGATLESVVGFLATASIGAIWAQCAPDLSPSAALSRFSQLSPKALITVGEATYNGVCRSLREQVAELTAGLPELRLLVDIGSGLGDVAGLVPTVMPWEEACSGRHSFDPVMLPFDHPLTVLFTSGTTGMPKGIVHGHGGILLQHSVLNAFHLDVDANDRYFWYTSTNWVMWNIAVSALTLGSTVVMYDGSPTYPTVGRLWALASSHRAKIFGTSPGYLAASAAGGVEPARDLDLTHLRMLGSTGSILPPDMHDWILDKVGDGVMVNSISGGTDIASAFAGAAPLTPVAVGELSGPVLGAVVEAWDTGGRSVVGQVGEMVVTSPVPSMPLRFWNDPGDVRYQEAYYSMYPDVWRQGDWITITERGTLVMHGRSDSTLNRNGIRMGSGDIYRVVESLPGVREALVLGIEEENGGYWMPLFVVLTAEHRDRRPEDVTREILESIRTDVSPRHVPSEVHFVTSIPHTKTGKKLEVPLKRFFQGAPWSDVLDLGSVDDPQALGQFVEIAHRRAGDPPDLSTPVENWFSSGFRG